MTDKKILIIPDIHTNYLDAELIISSEHPDKVIFLGDYFDNFDETPESADQTAYWLSHSLNNKDRIHLIGNHDVSYMTDLIHLRCSGFSELKRHAINMHRIRWDKMKLYHFLDDWLCTHAGVSKMFFEKYTKLDLPDFMQESTKDLENINNSEYQHRFLQAGKSRGGKHEYGGIVWCDYDEFKDIPGQKQIFGHTRSNLVRQTPNHICLDTGLSNYAIYLDKKMEIRKFTKDLVQ